MSRQKPVSPLRSREEVVAIIDGAARGNPGPAAYGVIFKNASGKTLNEFSGTIGKATNNVAEYHALLAALTHAREQGCRRLQVHTDSELLAHQVKGSYKVRKGHLKPLHEEARRLIAELESFRIEAVPRAETREADQLASAALDRRPATRGPRPVIRALGPTIRAVRAVFQGGLLKPRDPLDLKDGEEVELEIHRKP